MTDAELYAERDDDAFVVRPIALHCFSAKSTDYPGLGMAFGENAAAALWEMHLIVRRHEERLELRLVTDPEPCCTVTYSRRWGRYEAECVRYIGRGVSEAIEGDEPSLDTDVETLRVSKILRDLRRVIVTLDRAVEAETTFKPAVHCCRLVSKRQN